jgi:predicted HicB family RNase H-like nuclease
MAKRTINNPAIGLFEKSSEAAPAVAKQITEQVTEQAAEQTAPASAQILVYPERREPRSYRKQILLQPSIHSDAKAKCEKLGISLNEAVNQLLQKWIEQE